MMIAPAHRRAQPLPAQHFVARALPRAEWPHHPSERPAA
jgi:hypothetical protein